MIPGLCPQNDSSFCPHNSAISLVMSSAQFELSVHRTIRASCPHNSAVSFILCLAQYFSSVPRTIPASCPHHSTIPVFDRRHRISALCQQYASSFHFIQQFLFPAQRSIRFCIQHHPSRTLQVCQSNSQSSVQVHSIVHQIFVLTEWSDFHRSNIILQFDKSSENRVKS